MASPEALKQNFGNYTIQGIEEIVFPPPVSWLPSTLAWKLLGVILLILLITWLLRAVKKWQLNEYRRSAARRIAQMRSNIRSIESGHWQQLSELPALMKTTALHAYPRESIASLGGQLWLDFLNENCSGREFDQAAADVLTTLAYQPHEQAALSRNDAENLLDVCEYWIRRHQTANGAQAGD